MRRRRSRIAADPGEADARPLDPDRTLALAYVPAARRAAISALWQLDAALGAVLAAGREPLISRIKLTWWRDALVKLDSEDAPPEPLLQQVRAAVIPGGVTGAELSLMEEGWTALLSPDALLPEELALHADRRGGLLFRYSALLLRAAVDAELERAGECWALIDLARRSGAPDSEAAFSAAAERAPRLGWPARLRPLGMLAALAARDLARGPGALEPQGSPGRMLRMMRHRLTGR